MRKLKLEIDALAVDSFATMAEEREGEGTVRGQEMLATDYRCNRTTPYCKTVLTYCPCTPRWEEL